MFSNPPNPKNVMIRKHETNAEMVKRLLAVIEQRIAKSSQRTEEHGRTLEPTL